MFSVLKSQKIKYITKREQNRLFLFTFFILLFNGVSNAKTGVRNKYMIWLCVWLIFWTRSSIKLTLFYKFMQKGDLNVHVFQNKNWCSPKSDQCFFWFWLRVSLLMKKKYGGTWLISKKNWSFVNRTYRKSRSSHHKLFRNR